jgi:hypothetical protein
MVVERQLGGEVHRTFTPEGLEARLVVPLSHERWPQPVEPASGPEPDVDLGG